MKRFANEIYCDSNEYDNPFIYYEWYYTERVENVIEYLCREENKINFNRDAYLYVYKDILGNNFIEFFKLFGNFSYQNFTFLHMLGFSIEDILEEYRWIVLDIAENPGALYNRLLEFKPSILFPMEEFVTYVKSIIANRCYSPYWRQQFIYTEWY